MMLATRLNKAMKQERVEWHSLCQLFGLLGMAGVALNFVASMSNESIDWIVLLKLWGSLFLVATAIKVHSIESRRWCEVGNKFENILIFEYLREKSGKGSKEISDLAADQYNHMSVDERKKINVKLNTQLLTTYVVAAIILLMI